MNELRSRAIKLLARREHTRAELARKLAGHGTEDDIAAVINDLAQSGLLSDARAAAAFVRANAARFGSARLRQSLRQRGVDAELAETEIAAGEVPDEMERARAVWAKKFAAPPQDAREWAKQARFLQGRGFAPDLVRRLLKEPRE